MVLSRPLRLPSVAVVALMAMTIILPVALAHGDEQTPDANNSHDTNAHGSQRGENKNYPPSYFAHGEHASLIYAHIALMVLAWIFVLPVSVMFSLVSSRYTLGVQCAFLAVNALGLLFGTVYNAQTPDLYPGNAHHSIGWITTWTLSAQIVVGLVGRFSRRLGGPSDHGRLLSTEHQHLISVPAESAFDDSVSTIHEDDMLSTPNKEFEDSEGGSGSMALPTGAMSKPARWMTKAVTLFSRKTGRYVRLAYQVVDRIIMPFGFVALATGAVTFARFFEGEELLGGLAHWIKGGVFFWLGLFNLGRWSGSFVELGWAWNARPRRLVAKKWRPSAEFVESALIFFYGSTNIFLEHLSGWGGAWTPRDLEHISITFLFLGGGLCGMLIESTNIRSLLNTNIESVDPRYSPEDGNESAEDAKRPDTYDVSINPIPALIILLLGIMMSSHHQSSKMATMIHSQWGNLLTGASIARFLTYVIVFLKPPTSVYPSRPPTELLASFCLIAGGIIFMASASDTVEAMIHYELDPMLMYTVTMGFVGLLMAWEITVLALKGWASRKETRR